MFNLFCAERIWGNSKLFVQCLSSVKASPVAVHPSLSLWLRSHHKARLGQRQFGQQRCSWQPALMGLQSPAVTCRQPHASPSLS